MPLPGIHHTNGTSRGGGGRNRASQPPRGTAGIFSRKSTGVITNNTGNNNESNNMPLANRHYTRSGIVKTNQVSNNQGFAPHDADDDEDDDFVVLKRYEEYITDGVDWSQGLEERLINDELLRTLPLSHHHNQIMSNPVQRLQDVLQAIYQGQQQTALQAFLELLEDTNNAHIAMTLRRQMTSLDDSSGNDSDDTSSSLELSEQDPVAMKRKLLETRRKMKQWQVRAKNLEVEKETLEEDKLEMQQWFQWTLQSENESAVTIGKLQTQQDILKHELVKRERGLGMWKKKENEYQGQIQMLKSRIDTMADMIRQKETEGKLKRECSRDNLLEGNIRKARSKENLLDGKLRREKSKENILEGGLSRERSRENLLEGRLRKGKSNESLLDIDSVKCDRQTESKLRREKSHCSLLDRVEMEGLPTEKVVKKEKGPVNSPVLLRAKRNHDRSNTDPEAFPSIVKGVSGVKTLPNNAKLPSLGSAVRLPPEGQSCEEPVLRKPQPPPLATKPIRNIIDVNNVPNANPKLPPLIRSNKMPSPRGTNKGLVSELTALANEKAAEVARKPENINNSALKAVMGEKWIDRQGGEIDIGNVALHIPPNSVSTPVLITVTQTDHLKSRQAQISAAGLDNYIKPGVQVRLQPHGQKFLRPIYMQMKGANSAQGKLAVFHKEVDAYCNHDFTDVTEEVKPTVRKDDVVIALTSFSIIETMRLLVPVVSMAAGMAIGYNISQLRSQALGLVNGKKAACEFHVFHRERDPCLQVVCMGQGQTSNNNNNNINDKISHLSNLKYLGYQSSRSELCNGERLYFYLGKTPEVAASFAFNYNESMTKGQRFQIPLSRANPASPEGQVTNGSTRGPNMPEFVLVKRRIAEQVDDITLCEVSFTLSKPTPPSTRSTTGLDEPDGAADYEEPWEEAIRSNRVALVKNIDVKDILDYLIQNNIISIDEQEEIKSHRTRRERVSVLIDKLSTKGPKGFTVFVQALSEDYEELSQSLVSGQRQKTVHAT